MQIFSGVCFKGKYTYLKKIKFKMNCNSENTSQNLLLFLLNLIIDFFDTVNCAGVVYVKKNRTKERNINRNESLIWELKRKKKNMRLNLIFCNVLYTKSPPKKSIFLIHV